MKPTCPSSKIIHNRICRMEIEYLEFSLALVYWTSTIFVSWLNGPTAQRNSVSGFPFLNYGEEFMITVLCKPTFLKIIFLYLKRLHESQMCGLGKTNHFVQRLLWAISKNLLVSLELVIHFLWHSNFWVSIVGAKWSAPKYHSKNLQRHPQWYCVLLNMLLSIIHCVLESKKYEVCSGEIQIRILIYSYSLKNTHKLLIKISRI